MRNCSMNTSPATEEKDRKNQTGACVVCVCGFCARLGHLPCVSASLSGVCLPLAYARFKCLPASGDDRSCLLGCRPVRCQATELFSTMFTVGSSFCCACGARVRGVPACFGCWLALLARVPACLRMFTQHAARWSESDILPLGVAFLVLLVRSFWIVLTPLA